MAVSNCFCLLVCWFILALELKRQREPYFFELESNLNISRTLKWNSQAAIMMSPKETAQMLFFSLSTYSLQWHIPKPGDRYWTWKLAGNLSDRVLIGFNFESDWSKRWGKFSRPTTDCSQRRPMQFQINFSSQRKLVPFASMSLHTEDSLNFVN